jgi:hypothetical protein
MRTFLLLFKGGGGYFLSRQKCQKGLNNYLFKFFSIKIYKLVSTVIVILNFSAKSLELGKTKLASVLD